MGKQNDLGNFNEHGFGLKSIKSLGMKKYYFIDLFAGCGGFHRAFSDFAECAFAAELNTKARKTYELNYIRDEHPFIFAGDITTVEAEDIPDHDILCAGFPCTPFSVAGTQTGFMHKHGNLFFDIERILRTKQPKVVLLENVKHLVTHDRGNTFEIICDSLKSHGYNIKYKVLNATTYGNLPQNRERVYVVGFLDKGFSDQFVFPEEIPLTNKLFGDVIDISKKVPDKYYQTNLDSVAIRRMHAHITEKNIIYQSRRNLIRANKSGVCPTLTANMGLGGHNVPLIRDNFGIRRLTPRECFDLQGFPTSFKFPDGMLDMHLYKMAGNSIPLPVVKRIAEIIIRILTAEQNKSKGGDICTT